MKFRYFATRGMRHGCHGDQGQQGHHGHHQEGDFDQPRPFGGRGRGRGWGGPGGGRGGPGRMLEAGDLRFLMLHLMKEAPRHGYEIIKSIEEMLGGSYAPSPGIVYPTLTMLEEMGEAAVAVEGTRKLYSITPEGAAVLEKNQATVNVILDRMKLAREQSAHERPGQLIRAVENLRLVLRMKGGKLSKEQLNAVTDILDNAAKQIERIG